MDSYIVHQHHHYGWTTNVREAESEGEAAIDDIMAYHSFLNDFGRAIHLKLNEGRYRVLYLGPPRRIGFGTIQQTNDYWFGDQIRIGEADDCEACGGTGVDHYNPFCQCYMCGQRDARGKSSGKRHGK